MNNYSNFERRGIKAFAKKYGYYGILTLATLVMVLVISLTNVTGDPGDTNPVSGSGYAFIDPVANATVLKEYSGDTLLYNSTLNQWEAHKAIDFSASDTSNVLAVWEGTVEQVYTNYLEGTVVVIDHGNNLKTVYKSLNSEVDVEEGEDVMKGDIIGTAGSSANSETADGIHVHFEVWEDGTKIDPNAYLATAK